MMELTRTIGVAGGTASPSHNNLSTYLHDGKHLQYAAYAHIDTVAIVSWDERLEGFTNDTVKARAPGDDTALHIVQCAYVWVTTRSTPLLVMATTQGVLIVETENKKVVIWHATSTYCQGIASIEHYVLVGTGAGEVIVFSVSENSAKLKTPLKNSDSSVVHMANDAHNVAVAHADGAVLVYNDKVHLEHTVKIKHEISCIALLRGRLIIGSLHGRLIITKMDGTLETVVDAHASAITALDVSHGGKRIATCSEDSFVRVWKCSGDEMSYVGGETVPHAPLTGVAFVDPKGKSVIASAFDHANIFYIKQRKAVES